MANLEPIGSVVTLDARRFVVVGHRVAADGEAMGASYLVVPYPLGFVGGQSFSVVPVRAVTSVVHHGLMDDDGAVYLKEFEGVAAASAGVPVSEYDASVRLISDFMREEGRDGR